MRLVLCLFLLAALLLVFLTPACALTLLAVAVLAPLATIVCCLTFWHDDDIHWRDATPPLVFVGLALAALMSIPTACADTVPSAAQKYQRDLVRVAQFEMGIDAPIATLAAQIHQESRWHKNAQSPVGAQGLTQFMPGTASWMGKMRHDLGSADPFNPRWAMQAMVAYNVWHLQRLQARRPCEKWAMALAAYNGGLGWVQKDIRLASAKGDDPLAWFDSVERHNAGRSASAFKENRQYPRAILLRLEPLYVRAGWGNGVCV